MTMEYKSNYEKVTEDWKKRFLDMDQERLIERFQLNHDGQWLYLRYLGPVSYTHLTLPTTERV